MIIESQKFELQTKSKEQIHQGHIGDRRHVSMSHQSVRHKPISILNATMIQAAKVAMD